MIITPFNDITQHDSGGFSVGRRRHDAASQLLEMMLLLLSVGSSTIRYHHFQLNTSSRRARQRA